MKFPGSLLLMVLSFALSAKCVAAQNDQDNNSFTGTLIENAPDHLKVSREKGKTDGRVFKMTPQTKVEGGRLKLKQRIYVRSSSGDDGDIAILVIVRPSKTQLKKQK